MQKPTESICASCLPKLRFTINIPSYNVTRLDPSTTERKAGAGENDIDLRKIAALAAAWKKESSGAGC